MDGERPLPNYRSTRMTLMMFEHHTECVVIYNDTLVVAPDHSPIGFTTKAWAFPHLNMVMTATGTADVAVELHDHIKRLEHVRDITELDGLVPDALRQIQSSLVQYHEGDIGTSTIYLFGFPADSDNVVRYIYRSREDYVSERSEDEVIAIKPQVSTFEPVPPQTQDEWIELANRVRDEYAPGSEDPCPIGGEILVTVLTKAAIMSYRIHRFSDYDDTAERIHAQRGHAEQPAATAAI